MEDKEVQPLQHVHTGLKTVQVRLEHVLKRETIESTEEDTISYRYIDSPNYDIQLGKESTSWKIRTRNDREFLKLFLVRISGGDSGNEKIKFTMSIKTGEGELTMSKKIKERKVSEHQKGIGLGAPKYCEVDELEDFYVNDKITLVFDLTFTMEIEQRIRNDACVNGKYNTSENEAQFIDNMRSLYGLTSFSDLIIFCGDQKFLCHKIVLASRSSVFKEMLENEENKINGELEITETDPGVFKLLVDHVYSGKIPNDIDAVAKELYKLAIKYNLEVLAKACKISLLDQITDANALDTLVTMNQNKTATSTKNDVIKFITINAKEIIDTEDFKTFSKEYPELMIEIVRCFSNSQNKEVLSTIKTEESA